MTARSPRSLVMAAEVSKSAEIELESFVSRHTLRYTGPFSKISIQHITVSMEAYGKCEVLYSIKFVFIN